MPRHREQPRENALPSQSQLLRPESPKLNRPVIGLAHEHVLAALAPLRERADAGDRQSRAVAAFGGKHDFPAPRNPRSRNDAIAVREEDRRVEGLVACRVKRDVQRRVARDRGHNRAQREDHRTFRLAGLE